MSTLLGSGNNSSLTAEHLNVNWVSVVGSAVACQLFGSLWYSKQYGFACRSKFGSTVISSPSGEGVVREELAKSECEKKMSVNTKLGLHFLFNVVRSYIYHISMKEHARLVLSTFRDTPYNLRNPILAGLHNAFFYYIGFVAPARIAPVLWGEEDCTTCWIHLGHDAFSNLINALLAGMFC